MEKTCYAEINGKNFLFRESAYNMLSSYIQQYRSRVTLDKDGTMKGVEVRVEQMLSGMAGGNAIVTEDMIREIMRTIGLPQSETTFTSREESFYGPRTTARRLFRDSRHAVVGGVCSGLSIMFNIDVTILRIVFLLAMVFGLSGFWIYIICWIAIPEPKSFMDLCSMYGVEPTE
jgi:phage shock protein PspC (stress-responsive transcriptional regulator)